MNRIKELRERKGLTQVELAAATGLRQGAITNLETGRTKYPTLPIALRLAAALGVEPRDLIATDKVA